MPAPQRYDAPHEQLRQLGVKALGDGLDFEEFWRHALRLHCSPIVTTESVRHAEPPPGAIVWPKDSADRANALAAIRGTEEGWRRAYEGVPPEQKEVALIVLNQMAVEAAGGIPPGDAVPLTPDDAAGRQPLAA